MLKLVIDTGKAPEFEADIHTIEEVEDFAKASGQCLVEVINFATKELEEATNEQRVESVRRLLKLTKQLAFVKMCTLGWLPEDTMSLDELI